MWKDIFSLVRNVEDVSVLAKLAREKLGYAESANPDLLNLPMAPVENVSITALSAKLSRNVWFVKMDFTRKVESV